MRNAKFKSRRRRLVICPDNGFFWIYRGCKKDNERISCPDCSRKFYLADISLHKRKREIDHDTM